MNLFRLLNPFLNTLDYFFNCTIVFIPCMETTLIFCLCFIYYVGAGITTLMSISDGSDRTFLCRKMEKTRSVREEMDGKVFISRQNRHPFSLINNMIKVLFPICTLIWRVNNYVARQGEVKIGETKVQLLL